tara:strand:- start:845 stop:1141 length:297 start_codon:yes stop_codon:yes gene_type:complete
MKWIKTVLLWLMVKENRILGLRYTYTVLNTLDKVSKLTKSRRDDIAVKHLNNKLKPFLDLLPEKEIETLVKKINIDRRSFDIKYDKKSGVNAGVSFNF